MESDVVGWSGARPEINLISINYCNLSPDECFFKERDYLQFRAHLTYIFHSNSGLFVLDTSFRGKKQIGKSGVQKGCFCKHQKPLELDVYSVSI